MPQAPTKKKEALYELVEIPEEFGPVEVVVDEERVKAFAFAVDDYGDWYLGEQSPFGGPIGHPLVLANELLFLFYDKYDGNTARGLHTHEKLTFLSPVRRGEKVTLTGSYVAKYERRGQGYVVLEAVARGEDGRELVRHRGIEIMRAHAGSVVGRRSAAASTGRRVTGEVAAGTAPVDRARPGLAPRTPITPLAKHVTQEQMYVFSWGGRGYRNVHTDPGRAAESGLDATLVQAQQQTSFVTQAMTRFFGPSWLTSGELDMRFISPAFAGDHLTVGGAVLGEVRTPHGPGLELEVWIERPNGVKTGVGWAVAALTEPHHTGTH
ncbi:FAS1-like dehydratase domain-containing protein [Rhizohabitans arisaemae]|uniref:FAS1-like dehydratase domain-containing protein n=1 Tax=Rhizohabitans arisaemae TaxID=2720610 RepID=UPI0024B254E6|nr:MaoC family dehydratase N-terminal domain-containing protein [Rhizohabitans arisaemae]